MINAVSMIQENNKKILFGSIEEKQKKRAKRARIKLEATVNQNNKKDDFIGLHIALEDLRNTEKNGTGNDPKITLKYIAEKIEKIKDRNLKRFCSICFRRWRK